MDIIPEETLLDHIKEMFNNGHSWDDIQIYYKSQTITNQISRDDLCGIAAYMNHLNIIKFARENGCEWNNSACVNACMRGRVDIIKYLYENNAPYYDFFNFKDNELLYVMHPKSEDFMKKYGEHWKELASKKN